jgi:hypothetical protein
MDAQIVETVANLSQLGNVVPEGYGYYEKLITPAQDLSLARAYLKWYDLYPADVPITAEQREECREFVAAEVERLKIDHELGFVIFHRAGSWLLLMIMTWRNTNEIWESVYVKQVGSAEAYKLNEFPTTHRGTFCVWELKAVWHERDAWVRFLSSKRDEAAKLAYINDRFEGST